MILPEKKGWALYRRVSELLLSSNEWWRRMKWKLYATLQQPKKQTSSREEGLSSLTEGERAVAESHRGMMQDKVKFECQDATPRITGIFLIGRVELFTGGWVSCCWVPKRDMTQDKVKLVCRYATPWKMSIFLRGRAEVLTWGWVKRVC